MFTDLSQLAGQRIRDVGTSAWCALVPRGARHPEATVTRLDGAVETSIQLRAADVIADVVETGSTLRQAGLETFGETILTRGAIAGHPAGPCPRLRRSSSASGRGRWSRAAT